jgi:hypothetical protein
VAALLYVALLGAFFVDYYLAVRRAGTDEIVDYTPVVILLALVGLIVGVLIGRWWAVALPLTTFAFAAVMAVVGVLDDRYSAVAPDRGGVVGFDWFGVAALVCVYALPAVAIGVGLHILGDVKARRWKTGM